MTTIIIFILLVILSLAIYTAVRKYAPVYIIQSDTAPQIETEDATEDDTDIADNQAQIDLMHFEFTRTQYEELRDTINAEIEAIKDYRNKKLVVLPSLADDPVAYMELSSWLTDNKRDFSEKREASLQRQLITTENHIYNCDKRIAKAKQAIANANA